MHLVPGILCDPLEHNSFPTSVCIGNLENSLPYSTSDSTNVVILSNGLPHARSGILQREREGLEDGQSLSSVPGGTSYVGSPRAPQNLFNPILLVLSYLKRYYVAELTRVGTNEEQVCLGNGWL